MDWSFLQVLGFHILQHPEISATISISGSEAFWPVCARIHDLARHLGACRTLYVAVRGSVDFFESNSCNLNWHGNVFVLVLNL